MRCSLRRFVFTVVALCATAVSTQSPAARAAAPPASPAAAGISGDVAASPAPASPEGTLRDGLALENQQLWGDAIRLYEGALKKWEEDPRLSQRLLICRLHYDVRRRYEDSSFLESVRQLPTQQTLDLYGEVLTNLETHYVESPEWPQILRYGTASLEVALTEPAFLNSQLADVPAEKIEAFRQSVHRYVISRPAETRFDLRANASYVAGLARRELGLSGSATVMEYVCGAISTLDPYSRFLTANQLDETFSNIEGNFVGLGVELKAEEDRLRIVNVIPNGPAAQAGIQAGDFIIDVDGTSAADENPDLVADLLRGPEHTSVLVGLERRDGEVVHMPITRERVEVPCVENVQLVDSELGVGYFRLTSFQKTTTRDVDDALWSLHRQGMRTLVIDLRGNPGGLLSAAVEIADRFIKNGRIVITRGRNTRENFEYLAHEVNTWSVPLIVLVDGDSASASEIFAGAIRDQQRGHLIGERTYGKGSVQGIFRMQSAQAGLCLTTAKYFTPNNTAVNGRGIEPHQVVAPTYIAARPAEDGHLAEVKEDAILSAAVDYVRSARVSRLP